MENRVIASLSLIIWNSRQAIFLVRRGYEARTFDCLRHASLWITRQIWRDWGGENLGLELKKNFVPGLYFLFMVGDFFYLPRLELFWRSLLWWGAGVSPLSFYF